MIRGLYTAASGMIGEMTKTDVISNNLANVNTTGFKKDRSIFRAFPEMNIHRFDDPVPAGIDKKVDPKPFIGVIGTGVQLDEINTDFSQGSLKITSNPLDLSIRGEGFFEVQTPGGVRYTRDGSFSLDREGYMITKEGHRVLGQNGPLHLSRDRDLKINGRGEVFSNGQMLDRIRVVSFQDNELTKEGDNLYVSNAQPMEANSEIVQGALEEANLNTVTEMVDLISAFRAYEASQKVIRTHDETLEKAVNEIARL